MVILAHPVKDKQKSIDICNAFVQGAPTRAHGHVFYGVNNTNGAAWRTAACRGEDWYAVDNSYFDKVRGQQYRVTKNRFQVEARKHESDGERFAALGIEVQPMRSFERPGYCLAVEQSSSFMIDVAGSPEWLEIRMILGERDSMRMKRRPWSSNKPKVMQTLLEDLKGARLVLTHSSAAAVEALIAGVRISVSEMSCAYCVDYSKRLHAFNVLADNQFSLFEIQSGKAWSWLNRER